MRVNRSLNMASSVPCTTPGTSILHVLVLDRRLVECLDHFLTYYEDATHTSILIVFVVHASKTGDKPV